MSDPRIRVVLVEDHQIVREGLATLLGNEPDIAVVGEAADGAAALRLLAEQETDVAVVDIGLPGLNGVELTRRLGRERPDLPVLVLSTYDDAPTVDRALRAGARGYVVKGAGVADLCEAIRTVLRGEVYLSPAVSGHVLQGYLSTDAPEADPLSVREREVLQLVAEGYTARQIAERLSLSPKTVENHRANVMDKLGIRTIAGLVRYALRVGIIE